MASRRLPRNTQLVFPDDLELFNVDIERDAEGKESAQFTLNQWTQENIDAVIAFLKWIMPTAGLKTLSYSLKDVDHPDAQGAVLASAGASVDEGGAAGAAPPAAAGAASGAGDSAA